MGKIRIPLKIGAEEQNTAGAWRAAWTGCLRGRCADDRNGRDGPGADGRISAGRRTRRTGYAGRIWKWRQCNSGPSRSRRIRRTGRTRRRRTRWRTGWRIRRRRRRRRREVAAVADAGAARRADLKGVAALWGAQRVMRQRINRIHYSFYDTYGNSAFNAQAVFALSGQPAQNFRLDGIRRIQYGRAAENSTRLRRHRQNIFLHQFWRHVVAHIRGLNLPTVPTVAERNGRLQRG